jgi:glutathione peroxidase
MRLFLISLGFFSAQAMACPALLDRKLDTILDKPQSLCDYAGKVVLVVNTASECGYTPQYDGLEALYRKYKARGLVVLGFPMNDFGGQEPGSNKDIAAFCVNQYAIDFPMFSKTSLASNALFADLSKATGQAPKWNFHKYLVDRGGKRVQSYGSAVTPQDPKLTSAIEKLLEEK